MGVLARRLSCRGDLDIDTEQPRIDHGDLRSVMVIDKGLNRFDGGVDAIRLIGYPVVESAREKRQDPPTLNAGNFWADVSR